jgi:hypothetical protein
MSTIFCRSAGAAVAFFACLGSTLAPGVASAQYTEYVVRASPPDIPSADRLRDQLLDLIQTQAPTLEALRLQDQQLRQRQRPDVERLNGEVRTLIESQRETRDVLASEMNRLRDDQQAYLNLHPEVTEDELTTLRAEMQALKDRQRPVQEKMKADLMALIDRQKPARDALRQERMALREAQQPARDRVLDARAALEAQIEYASASEIPSEDGVATPRTAGLPGLEQFGSSGARSSGNATQVFAPADWSKPALGQVPVKLDRPALPGAAGAQ